MTALGARTRGPALVLLLGPAFVAAIAYVDPGNVAANIAAGGSYGYLLVWVVVLANATAAVVQYLSAKLGLATGRSLPELLGDRLPRPARIAFWVQAELVAAATDLAEVIGGALALQILFGLPLIAGGLIVGAASMGVLALQSRGQRRFESVVIGLLAVIAVGFTAGLVVSPVDWAGAAGGLVPRFAGPGTVLLAAGILGATVMPHAVYLHSALARDRHGARSEGPALPRLIAATRWDVGISLAIAGAVNLAMLLLAASALRGIPGTGTIPGAAHAIAAHLGPVVGVAFGIGLLASGLASTSVGSYAGGVIMAGLVHRRIPVLLRRLLTLIPALALIAAGVDPTGALIASQVALSFGIPFALVPLVVYTGRPALMGEAVNRPGTRAVAVVIVVAIVALNATLIAVSAAGIG